MKVDGFGGIDSRAAYRLADEAEKFGPDAQLQAAWLFQSISSGQPQMDERELTNLAFTCVDTIGWYAFTASRPGVDGQLPDAAEIVTNGKNARTLADYAFALLSAESREVRTAAANLLYLSTLFADFEGSTREYILQTGIAAFGLNDEYRRLWAYDGSKPDPADPGYDSAWAENINFRNMCMLEGLRPGAAQYLGESVFKTKRFGRYTPNRLAEYYDYVVAMQKAIDTGVPRQLRPHYLVLSAEDHNNQSYPYEAGSPFNTMHSIYDDLNRVGLTGLYGEFETIDDIVYMAAFVALAHGVSLDRARNSPVDLIPVLAFNVHGNPKAIGTGIRGSKSRVITAHTLDKYPPELWQAAEAIGVREILVTGCRSGRVGALLQYASAKLVHALFHGSPALASHQQVKTFRHPIKGGVVPNPLWGVQMEFASHDERWPVAEQLFRAGKLVSE